MDALEHELAKTHEFLVDLADKFRWTRSNPATFKEDFEQFRLDFETAYDRTTWTAQQTSCHRVGEEWARVRPFFLSLMGHADFDQPTFGRLDDVMHRLSSPLRQLSFWTMKKRARSCGEIRGHRLVAAIRTAGGDTVRIHLMGHSFGCIVVSSMLRGTEVAHPLRVSSAFLVQGALSLWSFAAELPGGAATLGWFRPVLDRNRISGPVVVTTSRFDRAVGSIYPVAAGAAGQVAYDLASIADLPTYGALGTFGARGAGLSPQARTLVLGDVKSDHALAPGGNYNVNGDAVIRSGGGLSGARSDIAHPEVVHLFWNAVLAAP